LHRRPAQEPELHDAQPGTLAFAVINNMLAQILGVELQRYAMTGNKILLVTSGVFKRAE
jgi:hypothetical protein